MNEPEVISHLRINERLKAADSTAWKHWFAVPHARRDGLYYSLYYSTDAHADPPSAPPTANMLWDFDAENIVAADGAQIAAWPDAAPVPHNLQSPGTNGGNQPFFRDNVTDNINGHPVLEIIAGDQMDMAAPNFAPVLEDQSFTHYWVGRVSTPIAASAILVYNYSNVGQEVIRLYLDGVGGASNVGYEYENGGTVDVNLAAAVSGVQLLTWVFDKTAGLATLYRNGTSVGSSANVGGVGAGNGYDWGNSFIEFFAVAGGVACAIGDHTRLVGYKVAHDTATRESIEGILKARYGIP